MNAPLARSRRRVLLSSHHASRRGSAISLIELGRRLPSHGFDPVFVFSKPGPLADELDSAGFPVHQVKRQGLLRLGMILQLQDIMRRERIDLVHVNSAVAFSKYVALAARLADRPVVWHIREPVEDKRMMRQRRWVRLLANKIVVLTRAQAQFFASPEKTSRVFNGVDLARFRRQLTPIEAKRQLGYAATDFLFVQIGSIERNKGQLRAIQALAKLLPGHPNVRLLVVGAIVERAEVEAIKALLASDNQLRAVVRLHGEASDVRTALWAADCLLLPSMRESFPRTVMEAMAGGVPVIASAVGAVPDMVENGVTGLMVSPCDDAALAGAMAEMLRYDPAQIDAMRKHCEAAAEALFSMENHVARIGEIYSSLLSMNAIRSGATR